MKVHLLQILKLTMLLDENMLRGSLVRCKCNEKDAFCELKFTYKYPISELAVLWDDGGLVRSEMGRVTTSTPYRVAQRQAVDSDHC